MIEGLLENPILTNLILGRLKKAIIKEKITLITISRKENGDLDFKVYKDEMKVIKKEDLEKLTNLITNE
jgi:hypothetical protein